MVLQPAKLRRTRRDSHLSRLPVPQGNPVARGEHFTDASFDAGACAKAHQGMAARFSPFWNGFAPEGREPGYKRFCKDRFRHLTVCVGRGSIRVCLDHLEKTGRIEANCRNPFIERPRWQLKEPTDRKKDGTSP